MLISQIAVIFCDVNRIYHIDPGLQEKHVSPYHLIMYSSIHWLFIFSFIQDVLVNSANKLDDNFKLSFALDICKVCSQKQL